MMNYINRYRSSPERRCAVIGFKSFMRITKDCGGELGLKNAFTELKTVKKGVYRCEKIFNVKICDLCAVAGIMAVFFIIKRKKNQRMDCER